ncbi:hypothetical protein ABG768_001274 [Culter alburnus]|uniref:Uncharacterized protein n=1 Tax=Culter alburnus TaxID=194366 RepID=A0AAW2BCF4_CULAL
MQGEDNIECPEEISAGQVQYQPEQDLQEEGVRRKQSLKRKHVEVDHLQRQMQGMQETLDNLLQAQQRPLGPLGPGELTHGQPCRHPDELSVIASGVFGREDNAMPSDQEDFSDSEMGDDSSQSSDPVPLDPSDKAVIARAAQRANLTPQAASTSSSVFDRGSQRRKIEGLPILPDFITELHSSWKAPSFTALPRTQLGNLAGAAAYGLASAPQIGPTFAMLAGATARAGRDATHPSKHSKTFQRMDMLIRGTSAHAQALGQSMASVVQACRQVWLSQANLLDQDCMAVVAAPLVPGEVFGAPSEAALEQSRRTRELTRSVRRAPAIRGPRITTGGSSWTRPESLNQAYPSQHRPAAQGALAGPSQGVRQSFRRGRQAETSITRMSGGRNRR